MATDNLWRYNEMIQAGANHAELERARTYDENMLSCFYPMLSFPLNRVAT
jgi:hypothetical protein